jgi:hypothetical protein
MEALMPSADPQKGKTESLQVLTHAAESLARAAELAPSARKAAGGPAFRNLTNQAMTLSLKARECCQHGLQGAGFGKRPLH